MCGVAVSLVTSLDFPTLSFVF